MLLHPGIQTIESSRQYLSILFDGQRSAAIPFLVCRLNYAEIVLYCSGHFLVTMIGTLIWVLLIEYPIYRPTYQEVTVPIGTSKGVISCSYDYRPTYQEVTVPVGTSKGVISCSYDYRPTYQEVTVPIGTSKGFNSMITPWKCRGLQSRLKKKLMHIKLKYGLVVNLIILSFSISIEVHNLYDDF